MRAGMVLLVVAVCLFGGWAGAVVNDGTLAAGQDLRFQYSPLAAGAGVIKANWTAYPGALSYKVAVGTSPGGTSVFPVTDVGNATSYTATGLSVALANSGTVYYVTVTPVTAAGDGPARSSNGVLIAEAVTFTGASSDYTGGVVRSAPDGGYSLDFPTTSGINTIFGDHYFETVNVPPGTTVYVQPFGRQDSVPEATSAADPRVATPKDGWVRFNANTISVAGSIEARGRGFGGGGGGGALNLAGYTTPSHGGANGLSGDGGGDAAFLGGTGRGAAGGAACGFGAGGIGGLTGGAGGGWGGPSGNPLNYLGGVGVPDGAGRIGGGGGGGYGAGGGGAPDTHGAGGGGGGCGGFQGIVGSWSAQPAPGGKGCGQAAGLGGDSGGINNGQGGLAGGYNTSGGNTDTSTDTSLLIGSGGGGGSHFNFEGGGGGGAGGGASYLMAAQTLSVSGSVFGSGGSGGGGGSCDTCNNYAGAGGAGGGGGGILLSGASVNLTGGTIRTLGGQNGQDTPTGLFGGKGGDGDSRTVNGGTVKIFSGNLTGTVPAGNAGRVFQAPNNYDPVANAGGPYAGDETSTIQLDGGGSSDPNLYITAWDWDLDNDGSYDDATGEYPLFPVSPAGLYPIGLRVTNSLGRTATASGAVTVLPIAPTDPGATAIGTDTITWTWTDNSTSETGFKVWDDPGAGAPVTLQTTTAADTALWQHAALTPNTQYTFQVAATSPAGDSATTAPFSAWTLAAVPVAPVVGNAAVDSLDVSVGAGDGNPADTEYALYCVTTVQWVQADGTQGAAPAWQTASVWGTTTVTGLAEYTSYAFTVTARNGAVLETAPGPEGSGATLDVTPPTGTVTINGAVSFTNNPVVTLTLTSGDGAGSGVAEMQFSNDNAIWSGWEGIAGTKDWTIESATEGLKTVYVQYRDAAGNVSTDTISASITLDTAAPTALITLTTPSPTASDTVVFTVDFSEPVGAAFDETMVTVAGTLGGTAVVTGADPNYTVTVTPADPNANGTVGIEIAAGAVADLAGNPCAGGVSALCDVYNWPGFAVQPQGAMLYTGGSHLLEVQVAGGGVPTTYQWKHDDGAKAVTDGPAAAQWALSGVTAANAGDYWCVVTFDGVPYESDHVQVSVADSLDITGDPADQTVTEGGTATFTVAAAGGYAPLHYQWKKGADNLPGSPDGPELVLNNVTFDDAGDYSVEVSDSHTASLESAAATLTVETGAPVAGGLGLAALALAAALGGMRTLRKKVSQEPCLIPSVLPRRPHPGRRGVPLPRPGNAPRRRAGV